MTENNDLGDMPEPTTGPAEPNPGGPDAMPGNVVEETAPADLPVETNPPEEEFPA